MKLFSLWHGQHDLKSQYLLFLSSEKGQPLMVAKVCIMFRKRELGCSHSFRPSLQTLKIKSTEKYKLSEINFHKMIFSELCPQKIIGEKFSVCIENERKYNIKSIVD